MHRHKPPPQSHMPGSEEDAVDPEGVHELRLGEAKNRNETQRKSRKARDKIKGSSGTMTAKPLKKSKNAKKKAMEFLNKTNNAARKIQGLYLSWRSRKHIRIAAQSMYEELLDPESGAPYYVNKRTGEAKWEKPHWFEPPKEIEIDDIEDKETLEQMLKRMRKFAPPDDGIDWPIIYPSGDAYEGMVHLYHGEYEPHGLGCMKTAKVGFYCGQWLNGKRHGYGVQSYADGSTYEGEWMLDQQHGYGLKIDPDGADYAGAFQKGLKSGLGVSRTKFGKIFEGFFMNDCRDGYGVEWHFEFCDGDGIDVIQGYWKCDEYYIPSGIQTEEQTKDMKSNAIAASREARKQIIYVYTARKRANQERQKAEDERKRTRLSTDMKKLAKIKGVEDGGNANPYITYLEVQLRNSVRKTRAAERHLRKQQHFTNIAEQQWTRAQIFNADMKKQRDDGRSNLIKALEWEPIAQERWASITEMRETLKQLRLALHSGKHQHRILNRKEIQATRKADILQKKLKRAQKTVDRNSYVSSDFFEDTISGGYGTPISPAGRLAQTPLKAGSRTSGTVTPLMTLFSNTEAYGSRIAVPGTFVDRQIDVISPGSPVRGQRFAESRGGITSAGSSVAGLMLTSPHSPLAMPGVHFQATSPQQQQLYYSPIRGDDPSGRAITPIPHGQRVPPLSPSKVARLVSTPGSTNHRPISREADKEYVGQYLDSFHARPLVRTKQKKIVHF